MILNQILLIVIYKVFVVVYFAECVSVYNNNNFNISLYLYKGLDLTYLSTSETYLLFDELDDTCFSVNKDTSFQMTIALKKPMVLININIVSEDNYLLGHEIFLSWIRRDFYGSLRCNTNKIIEC